MFKKCLMESPNYIFQMESNILMILAFGMVCYRVETFGQVFNVFQSCPYDNSPSLNTKADDDYCESVWTGQNLCF